MDSVQNNMMTIGLLAALAIGVLVVSAPWVLVRLFSKHELPKEIYKTPQNIEVPSKPVPIPERGKG